MRVRATVNFRGRVQGVFFRANTKQAAIRFGINGWVRNLPDGSVEAVFEGEREDIKDLIQWCRTEQPHALVKDAEVRWEEFKDEFRGFEVRY